MATLVAVDGDYLNRALKKKAYTLQSVDKDTADVTENPRLRVDFSRLADLLSHPAGKKTEDEVFLNYYTDFLKPDPLERGSMGRVSKYWGERGWGFIAGTDGKSYFFHNQDIVNRRDLRIGAEDRYPHPSSKQFEDRILGKIVSFNPTENEGRSKADSVRIEQGSSVEKYFRLRREPFLAMLQETGYNIVRCEPTYQITKAKDKSVDCSIYFDALRELHDETDTFVLVSDDSVFAKLVQGLREDGIQVVLVAFKSKATESLGKLADRVVFLDERLDEIRLDHLDEVSGNNEGSSVLEDEEPAPDAWAYGSAAGD